MECESRLKSTRERKFACIINSKKGDIMKLEKIKIVKITIILINCIITSNYNDS